MIQALQNRAADIAYMQSLRDHAIGFDMQAFYDDKLRQLRDAQFRALMMIEYRICAP